jgi:enoyl-CoA hydratase/carnithine racemase
MKADSAVLFAVDGPVATITLNRPDQRNTWSRELWDGLLSALDRLGQDRDLRVGILTGAGPTFSAGADL